MARTAHFLSPVFQDVRSVRTDPSTALLSLPASRLAALSGPLRRAEALGARPSPPPPVPVGVCPVRWTELPPSGHRPPGLRLAREHAIDTARMLWVDEPLVRPLLAVEPEPSDGVATTVGLHWTAPGAGATDGWSTASLSRASLFRAVLWAGDCETVARAFDELVAVGASSLIVEVLTRGVGPIRTVGASGDDRGRVRDLAGLLDRAVLRPLLSSPDEAVRQAALEVLGRGGRGRSR